MNVKSVRVGYASCVIAAGAEEVYRALKEHIEEHVLDVDVE